MGKKAKAYEYDKNAVAPGCNVVMSMITPPRQITAPPALL
jgi:hypothetical protein